MTGRITLRRSVRSPLDDEQICPPYTLPVNNELEEINLLGSM